MTKREVEKMYGDDVLRTAKKLFSVHKGLLMEKDIAIGILRKAMRANGWRFNQVECKPGVGQVMFAKGKGKNVTIASSEPFAAYYGMNEKSDCEAVAICRAALLALSQ